MTREAFNTKYKDYIEKGFEGSSLFGEAVHYYLDEVFHGLIKIPGFRFMQVKEKFGNPRVYTNISKLTSPTVGMLFEHGLEQEIKKILNAK